MTLFKQFIVNDKIVQRIVVNDGFLIDCLGGEDAVSKLEEYTGIRTIFKLIYGSSTREEHPLYYYNENLQLSYNNYLGSVNVKPYADIQVRLYRAKHIGPWDIIERTVCSDIGYRETLPQTRLRVKQWFEEEVIPLMYQDLFLH